MTSQLTGYRIFIASPGGLQEVRRTFREVIEKYNTEDAMRRGVVFIPVGWEHTIGGVGRPQALINKDLDECDGFVLVLHDRWGSNAGGGDGATGTEEEYQRAIKNVAELESSMEELLVFFRSIETERMSDPGPQLQQVLTFKKKLEVERTLLFHQFETERDFEDKLRIFLASWVRAHERGERKGQRQVEAAEIVPAEVAPLGLDQDAKDPTPLSGAPLTKLEEAADLARNGRLTDAEAIYADLAAPNNDPLSLLQYGDFLWKLKRKSQAELIYRRAIETAKDSGDALITGRAHLKLGYLLAKKDDLAEALTELKTALDLVSASNSPSDIALARLRLGEVYAVQGEAAGARELYQAAVDILHAEDDPGIRADLYAAMAQGSADVEDYETAADLYQQALELKEKAGSVEDVADILVGLGSSAEMLKRPEDAVKHYERSLPMFEAEGELAGRADALDHLGHAYNALENYEKAAQCFDSAAGIFESIQKYDSAADIYTSLAKLYAAQGQSLEAASAYRQALALVGRLKNRDEIVEIYGSLASLVEGEAEGS
jgi:tetratricopeptide (TPR) repeat protein